MNQMNYLKVYKINQFLKGKWDQKMKKVQKKYKFKKILNRSNNKNNLTNNIRKIIKNSKQYIELNFYKIEKTKND